MNPLNDKLNAIADEEARLLINEVEIITRVNQSAFSTMMLIHYLNQCMYPNGGTSKAVKISKDDLNHHDPCDAFTLRKRVGKLGNYLHGVCFHFAEMRRKPIDDFNGTALYVFLNRIIVPTKTKRIQGRYF